MGVAVILWYGTWRDPRGVLYVRGAVRVMEMVGWGEGVDFRGKVW